MTPKSVKSRLCLHSCFLMLSVPLFFGSIIFADEVNADDKNPASSTNDAAINVVEGHNSQISDKCKDEIRQLFNAEKLNPIDVRTGGNCYNPGSCIACAHEKVLLDNPVINFRKRNIFIQYKIDRDHVWGSCPGSEYNESPDHLGPITARIKFGFNIDDNGIFKITDDLDKLQETRVNPKDDRHSWALSAIKDILVTKSDLPLKCEMD